MADATTEAELLELARGATTAQLERIVRAWKKGSRRDEAERDRERRESRTFSVFPDDDGMYVVRGRLTPEVGSLLMRAIEAAGDALYRERPVSREASQAADWEAAQRRADAIGLLAERALAAGFGAQESGDFHHALVHEGGWRVDWWGAGRPVFLDPRGGAHFDGGWQPPVLPEQPAEALVQQNHHLGIEPDPWTAGARWRRERDIPDRVYFRALEAS